MIKEKKILTMIPARGGSKGLPGKNVKTLCGKPLIAWSVEQALQSRYTDRVFVSTDSQDIARIAKTYGADVPFMRPPELAKDASPTSDAVLQGLAEFERMGEVYDYIVLLEPTSPLRKPGDIDRAIRLISEIEDADSLVSMGEIHMEHPMIAKRIDDKGFVTPYIEEVRKIHQRQQADKAYFPYGVIYIAKVSAFKETKTFYNRKTISYLIERWQNFEIDDETDFLIVEKIMGMKREAVENG